MLALLVSALLVAPQAPAPRTEASRAPAPAERPGLSRAEAESLARKLEAIGKRAQKGTDQVVPVTQGELTSYLNLDPAAGLPAGVSDLTLRLERDRFASSAYVDLDRFRSRLPPLGPWNPLSFLSGVLPVEVEARFTSEDGFGTLAVEQVRVGGFTLPASLLQQAVLSATRNAQHPEGVDIAAPFRLPYQVKRVRLQPGKALIEL